MHWDLTENYRLPGTVARRSNTDHSNKNENNKTPNRSHSINDQAKA